nr:MAG TPA: hypothetical protein [Caudoviricetes sp.]
MLFCSIKTIIIYLTIFLLIFLPFYLLKKCDRSKLKV